MLDGVVCEGEDAADVELGHRLFRLKEAEIEIRCIWYVDCERRRYVSALC